MAVRNRGTRNRRPTHPAEFLREDFMPDHGLGVAGLAGLLGVSRQTVNELLLERRALSPEMALRLSRLFGTSAEFWLDAQRTVDLWDAERTLKDEIARIEPIGAAESYKDAARDSQRFAAVSKKAASQHWDE